MKKKTLAVLPTYILAAIFIFPLGLFGYTYFTTDFSTVPEVKGTASVSPAPAEPVPIHIAAGQLTETSSFSESDAAGVIYPDTQTMRIKNVSVEASIAKTWTERIQGLSGTPYLPENIVKVFVFDTDGFHSIWMKDMQYAIDIIWVGADSTIVDTKAGALPESFPESFVPQTPARYVIETAAGFLTKNQITVGDTVEFPVGL